MAGRVETLLITLKMVFDATERGCLLLVALKMGFDTTGRACVSSFLPLYIYTYIYIVNYIFLI